MCGDGTDEPSAYLGETTFGLNKLLELSLVGSMNINRLQVFLLLDILCELIKRYWSEPALGSGTHH